MCGAGDTLKKRDYLEYLEEWDDVDPDRVRLLVSAVSSILKQVAETKDYFKARADIKHTQTIASGIGIQPFKYRFLVNPTGRLKARYPCPICETPPGYHYPREHGFHAWDQADHQQVGHLLGIVDVIAWRMIQGTSDGFNGQEIEVLNRWRQSLNDICEALFLLRCPICGRYDKLLYGEAGDFCHICGFLDGDPSSRLVYKARQQKMVHVGPTRPEAIELPPG